MYSGGVGRGVGVSVGRGVGEVWERCGKRRGSECDVWPDLAGYGRTWPDLAGYGRIWPNMSGSKWI